MEADWLVYTPLLTYAHGPGVSGTRLIPGLASHVPTITDGGTTYQLTLRTGLVYSNGQPVRASDFTWAVERAIRLGWAGSRSFILGRIDGATAFADGRTRTVSGIQANDSTGQITIRLTAADGEFDDVLALPALAPVPSSTPVRDEPNRPPPGVGPYTITDVIPSHSFSLVRNPRWAAIRVPGIPTGHVGIDVRVSADPTANALAVLDDKADVLDPDNGIPPIQGRMAGGAAGRHATETANATYAITLEPGTGPFSNQLVREAVIVALDRRQLNRLASGALQPGCYLLPPAIVGHPSAACPYRKLGNVTRARALVRQSGWAGAPVTVRSEAGSPLGAMTSYYVSVLDRIGFRAAASTGPRPQTGLVLVYPPLPDPAEIYGQLGGLGDSFIDRQLAVLAPVPAGQLDAVSTVWMALDQYTSRKAYLAVLGYPTVSELFSNRIDAAAVIYQPVVGLDWSSLALN